MLSNDRHRDESDHPAADAFDTLLRACGHIVTVRKAKKPKKKAAKRTPFNRFDAEPKRDYFARGSHKQALRRATGIKS